MWELDCKEGWVLKNWFSWTMVLEKTLQRCIQPILGEIGPGCSLEGLRLKLKLSILITWYKELTPLKESFDQTRQHIQKQRHYFVNKGPSSQRYGFSSSHVWMWELDYIEGWVPKNWCFWTMVLQKTLESPLDCKEIQPVHPKGNQSWVFIGRTDVEAENSNILATWCKELTHWKRPWCWERLRAGGEGDNRGWDGWMASLIQWTWVWVDSGSWWWTGRPGMLRFMGLQGVEHERETELNWTELRIDIYWYDKSGKEISFEEKL